MNYDEFQGLRRGAWKNEDYNYVFIDGSIKREECNFCIRNEGIETYLKCVQVASVF